MKRRKLFSRKSVWIVLMGAAAMTCATPAGAKVKRIVFDKTKSESRAYDGKSFGSAGQYEKIVGQAYGELDPKDRRNAIIHRGENAIEDEARLALEVARKIVEIMSGL